MKHYYIIIALLITTQIYAENTAKQNIISKTDFFVDPSNTGFDDDKIFWIEPPTNDIFSCRKVTVNKNTIGVKSSSGQISYIGINQKNIADLLVSSVLVEFITPPAKKENSSRNTDKHHKIKTYSVQIGAFSSKPHIQNVYQIKTMILKNGITKYFTGNFSTYEDALKRKKEVIAKGYQDAFIVTFENGKMVK